MYCVSCRVEVLKDWFGAVWCVKNLTYGRHVLRHLSNSLAISSNLPGPLNAPRRCVVDDLALLSQVELQSRGSDQSSTLRESARCPVVIFKLTPQHMTWSGVEPCRQRWMDCLEIGKGSLYLWGGLRCCVKTGLACHSPSDSPASPELGWPETQRGEKVKLGGLSMHTGPGPVQNRLPGRWTANHTDRHVFWKI